MNIQHTNEEIIIRIPNYVNINGLQRIINLLSFNELVSKNDTTQAQVDELASEINKNWWNKNKDKFLTP